MFGGGPLDESGEVGRQGVGDGHRNDQGLIGTDGLVVDPIGRRAAIFREGCIRVVIGGSRRLFGTGSVRASDPGRSGGLQVGAVRPLPGQRDRVPDVDAEPSAVGLDPVVLGLESRLERCEGSVVCDRRLIGQRQSRASREHDRDRGLLAGYGHLRGEGVVTGLSVQTRGVPSRELRSERIRDEGEGGLRGSRLSHR